MKLRPSWNDINKMRSHVPLMRDGVELPVNAHVPCFLGAESICIHCLEMIPKDTEAYFIPGKGNLHIDCLMDKVVADIEAATGQSGLKGTITDEQELGVAFGTDPALGIWSKFHVDF